jgi:hypothetical protein
VWGRDAPEEKLGIGLPFFGRVIGTSQSPQGGTAYTYSQLVAGGTTTDGNYYTYQNRPVWIPGPDLAAQRVEFANERGLQHVIIWELAQDLHPSNPNSLLRAAYEAQQSLLGIDGDYNHDGRVNAADYVVWRKGGGTTYEAWRANYGRSSGAGAAARVAVPEPAAGGLLLLLIFALTRNHASRAPLRSLRQRPARRG